MAKFPKFTFPKFKLREFLIVRIAGALAATSLALAFVALIPFLSAAPTSGAGRGASTSGFTVNREFKGDRLPIISNADTAVSRNPLQSRNQLQSQRQARDEIPVGCDPAFSAVTNPQLASYYGRCTT